MQFEFESILILLSLSVITILIINRLNLSPLIGYLIVGVLISEHTTGILSHNHTIGYLAEFGVVFLLFSIGVDFSLEKFNKMRHAVLRLGSAQVLIGTLSGFIIASWLGLGWQASLILGGALALSSTALVMKQLVDQLELQTEHGLTAFGILLFQDLAAIPFLVLIPILAEAQADQIWLALSLALVKGAVVIGIIIALGIYVIPRLFHLVSFSTELFTLTVLLVSLTAAWLTHEFGMSLALGAFLAGFMVSESRYRYQIENEIRPFRDILLGLFFITVGMQLDVYAIIDNWFWVIFLVCGLMIGKGMAIYVVMRLNNYSKIVSSRTGMILGQGGEFSIALLTLAVLSGLISISDMQPVLAAVILSMLLSPLLIRNNQMISARLFRQDANDQLSNPELLKQMCTTNRKQRVLICGYGSVGEKVAHKLEEQNIEYVALETNADIVRTNWEREAPVYLGDATNRKVLESAGILEASAVIVCVDRYHARFEILRQIRSISAEIPIIMNTHDNSHHESLLDSGATVVYAEAQLSADSIVQTLLSIRAETR